MTSGPYCAPIAARSPSQSTRSPRMRATGKVLAGSNPLDRVALLRARDRHHHEPGARDRGKGEREPRMRMLVVAGGDHEALGLVERRASREQRRGVAVGPEPEVHEVDRRRRAHQRRRSARAASSIGTGWYIGWIARGPHRGRAAPAAPCPRWSRDRRPARSARRRSTRRRSTSRGRSRAPPRSTPRRSRRPRARPTRAPPAPASAGERERDVVDDLDRAGERHVCHSSLSWTASTVDVYEQRAAGVARAEAPPDPRLARRVRGAGARRARVRLDLGCGPAGTPPGSARRSIASDAAQAMLDLVPEHAPGRGPRASPISKRCRSGRGALGGIWAHKCYMHIAAERVPLALADAHRALQVGGALHVQLTSDRLGDERRRPVRRPPLHVLAARTPGRRRGWARASRSTPSVDDGEEWIDVEATRARTLRRHRRARHATADRRAEPERVLGRRRARLRPARATASGPPRSTPASSRAPTIPSHALRVDGIGMTDLVKRATPRADELTRDEYRSARRASNDSSRGSNRARSASSGSAATASRSTARRSPAGSRSRSAAGPPT